MEFSEFLFNPLDLPESSWEGLSAFDHLAHGNVSQSKAYKKVDDETNKYSSSLGREAFMGFYNGTAELNDEAPNAAFQSSHSLLSRAQELPEYQQLRRELANDEWASVIGTGAFVNELISKLPEEVKEKMAEDEQAQQNLQNLQQAVGNGQGGGPRGSGPSTTNQQMQQALKDAEAHAQQTSQALKEFLDKSQAQTNHSLMQAANSSQKDVKNAKDTAQAFGWSLEGGELSQRNIEEVMALSEMMKASQALKTFIDSLGWAQSIMRSEIARKIDGGMDNFVEYGNAELTLEKMAPEEWIGLASPNGSPLALDWAARAADGAILHAYYDHDDDHMGKGPLVVLEDTSGSMDDGQRLETMKSISLVLMQQMIRQKRRFCAIPFSGSGTFHLFDPGPSPSMKEIIEHIGFSYHGGTEPYAPMMKALEIIKTDTSFKEGSILMITDEGFGAPPNEFLDELEKVRNSPGVNVVVVTLMAHPGQAASWADTVITIDNVFNERAKFGSAIASIL